MTEILQMFTGNPLATYVGKRIEAATNPTLTTDDWATNMEIVDMINQNDDDAKDAVRAIKKRLQQIEQDTNFTVTNRTLTVLETCVKNCSRRFHVLVMSKDFIQDLVKLIGPKNNPPIELQERVLKLIERWADEFRNQPDLSGVVLVYNDLKTKGVTFPPKDPNSMVPIQTPQRSVPSPTSYQQQQQQHGPSRGQDQFATNTTTMGRSFESQLQPQPAGPVVLEGGGYNKISQDLGVVQTSIEMFNDIIKILETKGEESDWKLASDLNTTCRQMKDRIVDLIERVANEDLTIELLRLNDELNNIFIKYDRLVKNNTKQPIKTTTASSTIPERFMIPQPASFSKPPVVGKSENELSLIDFNVEDTTTASGIPASSSNVGGDTEKKSTTDPFDSSTAVQNKPLGDSLADEMEKINLVNDTAGGSKQAKTTKPGLPVEISSVREQDFAEIENWLSTDSGRGLVSMGTEFPSIEPISIPNSEFDNFIASRALAGASVSQGEQGQQSSNNSQITRKPQPSL